MLANFKWKQNSNWFSQNSQNINRKGRPIEDLKFLLKEAIATDDLTLWLSKAVHYVFDKKKVKLKDLLMVQNIAFARWYYLTWWDMKKYYKIFRVK